MSTVAERTFIPCVLNDRAIEALFTKGIQVVDPFDPQFLQPASLDLRLGNTYYRYDIESYRLGEEIGDDKVVRETFDDLTVQPNQTVFVSLYERISIPNDMMGIVLPRSSISRLGIRIQTAYMNPGYVGIMPLMISNNMGVPLTLLPGRRVAQLLLFALGEPPERTYDNIDGAKYHSEVMESSRLHSDAELQELLDSIIRRKIPSLSK